jgi:hypothetical protein
MAHVLQLKCPTVLLSNLTHLFSVRHTVPMKDTVTEATSTVISKMQRATNHQLLLSLHLHQLQCAKRGLSDLMELEVSGKLD